MSHRLCITLHSSTLGLLDLAGVSETGATSEGGQDWPAAVGYRDQREQECEVVRLRRSKDGVQSERLVTEEAGESKQIQHSQERFPEGAVQSGETFMTHSQMIRERIS